MSRRPWLVEVQATYERESVRGLARAIELEAVASLLSDARDRADVVALADAVLRRAARREDLARQLVYINVADQTPAWERSKAGKR
jgi:hypothetical protein